MTDRIGSSTTPSERDSAHPALGLSETAIASSDDWRELVVHAEGDFVGPAEVAVRGDHDEVTNETGLLEEKAGTALLQTSAEHSATLIIDLGRVAMGHVEVQIKKASAVIRVSYSEFEQFISPEGDGMGDPFGTDAHPWSRVDLFEPPAAKATLLSPGKREARYIAVTLEGPGEAEIESVRVRQEIYPVTYDGYFLSSDELLNQAWYHSAYTGDLATVSEESSLPGAPSGPSPWMLTVTYDRVLFMCDLHLQAIAGYYQSSDYRWLVRNTLQQFGCVQNPDGSFPAATSHLVTPKPGDPGPPDGWRSPMEGPDPDKALGFIGPYSIHRDFRLDSMAAFWVAAVADYYLYTADAEFVTPLLPVARRAIAFLTKRTTEKGLYFEPDDQRVDPKAELRWVGNWSPGDLASGVDSMSNAVYYDALRGLALLEHDLAQDPETSQRLMSEAGRVREALIDHLWDPESGAMVLNDKDPLRDHTGDANAGNLVFRTLDEERAQAAMDFLASTLATPHGTSSSEFPEEAEPAIDEADRSDSEEIVVGFKHHNRYRAADMQGYINALEALGRVRYGDGQGAVDLIRRWWGHMLAHGPGTGWFSWRNDGSVERGAFANTAWTTALPALSEGVLGVRPLAPGYTEWEVAPQIADLTWAQGRVPVPGGSISSRWERSPDNFVLTVEGTHEGIGRVAVPLLGQEREIAMDGKLIWQKNRPVGEPEGSQEGDAVVFTGVRGSHTFAWAQ